MSITPEQFNQLATKADLANFYNKSEIDDKFSEINNRFSELLHVLDRMAVQLNRIEHSFVSNQVAHDRFDNEILKLKKLCLNKAT